jgi:copper(I)-binding protein
MTATPAMPGMAGTEASSAAYFVIVNDGSGADALIGVAADMASAAMHETHLVGDVAQMAPVARVVVPAHARVEFKPGGYHVMLTGLKHDLVVGDTLKLTLQFEKSGAVTVEVPVRQEPSK